MHVFGWIVRRATLLLAFGTLLIAPLPTLAQTPVSSEPTGRQFGHYNERTLDLSVKVANGEIKVWRDWQGDRKQWAINPQHDDLDVGPESLRMEYGLPLPFWINRGPYQYRLPNNGSTFLRKVLFENAGQVTPMTQALVQGRQITYCSSEGTEYIDAVMVNPQGFKYVRLDGRTWSQHSRDGKLLSYGVDKLMQGQIHWDPVNNRKHAIADANNREVIFYDYDSQGRVSGVHDLENNQVTYTYIGTSNQIDTVIDADGLRTKYEYQNGEIVTKTVGSLVGVVPGEEINNQAVTHFAYDSGGQYVSWRDQDNIGADYEYSYNAQQRLFTQRETKTDGRVRTAVTDADGYFVSLSEGGEFTKRIDRLCEDYAVVDASNRVTYIDRDRYHAIRKVYLPDGREISYQNSGQQWPEAGEIWNSAIQYPWGITGITFPDGSSVAMDRDIHGKVTRATLSATGSTSRVWSFQYDALSNLTEERLQAGATPDNNLDRIRRYSYDSNGLMEWAEDAYGHRWTYEYTLRGDRKKVTDPAGKIWTWTRSRNGKLLSSRSPIGYEKLYEYTNRRLLKRVRDRYDTGLEAVTLYNYNDRGLVVGETDPLQNLWRTEYTAAGEVSAEIDPVGVTMTYGYDHKGRMRLMHDANGRDVTYEYYDTAPPGQAPQTSLPYTPSIRTRYPSYYEEQTFDLASRLIRSRMVPETGTPEEIQLRYWNSDLLKEVTRPDGLIQSYAWDLLHRQISMTEPAIGTSTVSYPEAEKRTLYHDPVGGIVEQVFNQNAQLVKEIRADGTEETYQYDSRGNRSDVISSLGAKQHFIYDDANRLAEVRTYATATATTPVRTVIYSYTLRGDLLLIADTGPEGSGTTQSYTRDAMGRVLTASTNYGPFTKSHSYTYRANGTLNTQTAPDGTVLTYFWDPANQFQGISIPGEGAVTMEYLPRWGDLPIRINYPGGSKQERFYNDLTRIQRIHSMDQAGANVMDYQYSYEAGPLEGSKITGIATEVGNYAYTYDQAFRLTNSVNPDGTSEGYTYDGLSRRQPATGTPWTYNANGAPLTSGTATYSYDANGNRQTKLESGVQTEFRYSKDDRLKKIERPVGTTIADYTSDFFGRRIKKQVSGGTTYYYYTDDGLAAELDSTGAVQKSYYFAPGSLWTTSPIIMRNSGAPGTAGYNYYHNDHLGTPQRMTDRSGAVTWEGRYKAYGEMQVVRASPGLVNNLRFPGQYADAESGLNWNFQRDYDPGVGGYIEEDPLGVSEGANRFGYVDGEPIGWKDPRGEEVVYGDKVSEKVIRPYVKRLMQCSPGRKLLARLHKEKRKITLVLDPCCYNSASGTCEPAHYVDNRVCMNPNMGAEIDTDKGPKVASGPRILAHELGHAGGAKDDGPDNMNNVNQNENPIMGPLEGYNRTRYSGRLIN